ncbi:MAG: hypothetical protein FWF15_03260 [Oscillospiraceae bacterium]|nr:hypothetical protein [Oscillospiraceae bacterium]
MINDLHTIITNPDFSALDRKYAGRKPYWGDLHVHTNSGGTSDGSVEIGKWPGMMRELQLDFAAVMDHRQVRHMFLPEWDDAIFIGGSEAGTMINGLNAASYSQIHYNMLLRDKGDLQKVLETFPEFQFDGENFQYPSFTKERMCEIAAYIRSIGGAFVHAHPKQLMVSGDPLDYYYGERTGLEVILGAPETLETTDNYKLWLELLAAGKKVYATAGSDSHEKTYNTAVNTVYLTERSGAEFVQRVHEGDFTAGAVGIKMCATDYVLLVSIGDIFPPVLNVDSYSLNIYTDRGLVCTIQENRIALKLEKRVFYRAEIHDGNGIIAIGNPIWLA